jgi:hypothetical protein
LLEKICAFLLIIASTASALTLETRADWPAGERLVKYNATGQVPGGLTVGLNGQYYTSPGKEDLTFFPNLSWQTPQGRFSASLSGRQLLTSQEESWRIWKGSWEYPHSSGNLSATGLRVFFPSGKEAQEWSCQYLGKNQWGNWGGQYFQREAFVNQWSLPNRESLPWQRLRAQELYGNGQLPLVKYGATHGYYWEWDRNERLQEGMRTLLWTEVTTSPWQLGPVAAVSRGRWQEADYGISSLRALCGELNVSYQGYSLPLTAIYWKRKKVEGSTPFLFDREWDLGEVSLKSNLTGALGGWELFSRYDYLGEIWRECWLSYKANFGAFTGDSRFHFAPQTQKLLRSQGNYALHLPGSSIKLHLDYNVAEHVWNNRLWQLSCSFFSLRYQNRAGYSPQWTGSIKTSQFQFSCDWWEQSKTAKVSLRSNTGRFEVNYGSERNLQFINRWDL